MNCQDFTFWLLGCVGNQSTPPNQAQWDRIRNNLHAATRVKRLDRFLLEFSKDMIPEERKCATSCHEVSPPKSESWKMGRMPRDFDANFGVNS